MNRKELKDEIKKIIEKKCIGPAVDLARISSMDDRAFGQFQRTFKDVGYSSIDDLVELFEKNGAISEEEIK